MSKTLNIFLTFCIIGIILYILYYMYYNLYEVGFPGLAVGKNTGGGEAKCFTAFHEISNTHNTVMYLRLLQ